MQPSVARVQPTAVGTGAVGIPRPGTSPRQISFRDTTLGDRTRLEVV
jgi:hypothetical protein